MPGACGCASLTLGEMSKLSPKTFSISSGGMGPGLRSFLGAEVIITIVDSTPHAQLPPSRTKSILSPSIDATCSAVVGLTYPNGLADGAAMGFEALIRLRITGCEGILTATVSIPAVTMSGIAGVFFRTIVSGPGQKASASFSASGVNMAISRAMRMSHTWTINGSINGLPFAANIFRTASGFVASAASP